MVICEFIVDGYCQPKQRTFGRSFITPPATRNYEILVKTAARAAMKNKDPYPSYVKVYIQIDCSIPKSWSKKKRQQAKDGEIFPSSSDIDNAAKSLLDGMNFIVFCDDRQVVELHVRRDYAECERVFVVVSELAGD